MEKDIKICEYSGLRPVEGYKEEEASPQDPAVYKKRDNTTIEDIHNIHKEMNNKETTEIGDINYMYKWIREKSGK